MEQEDFRLTSEEAGWVPDYEDQAINDDEYINWCLESIVEEAYNVDSLRLCMNVPLSEGSSEENPVSFKEVLVDSKIQTWERIASFEASWVLKLVLKM